MSVMGRVSDRDRIEIRRSTTGTKISAAQETKPPDVAIGALDEQRPNFARIKTETRIGSAVAAGRIQDDPYFCVIGSENGVGIRRRTRLGVAVDGHVVIGDDRVADVRR